MESRRVVAALQTAPRLTIYDGFCGYRSTEQEYALPKPFLLQALLTLTAGRAVTLPYLF